MQRRCMEGKLPGSCPLCSPPTQGAAPELSGNGGSLTMWPRNPSSSGSLPKTQPYPPKAQRRSTVLMSMLAPGWAVDSDAWCFSGICWDAGNARTLPAWGNSSGSARFEELWPCLQGKRLSPWIYSEARGTEIRSELGKQAWMSLLTSPTQIGLQLGRLKLQNPGEMHYAWRFPAILQNFLTVTELSSSLTSVTAGYYFYQAQKPCEASSAQLKDFTSSPTSTVVSENPQWLCLFSEANTPGFPRVWPPSERPWATGGTSHFLASAAMPPKRAHFLGRISSSWHHHHPSVHQTLVLLSLQKSRKAHFPNWGLNPHQDPHWKTISSPPACIRSLHKSLWSSWTLARVGFTWGDLEILPHQRF